jgi:hypothetical protein
MKTDVELLEEYVVSKSESAFTELVQRHFRLVYSVASRRLRDDAHLAEDVAQTVFNDLARKALKLQDRATLGGWLYISANTASAAVARREGRRMVRETAAHDMQTTVSSEKPYSSKFSYGPRYLAGRQSDAGCRAKWTPTTRPPPSLAPVTLPCVSRRNSTFCMNHHFERKRSRLPGVSRISPCRRCEA